LAENPNVSRNAKDNDGFNAVYYAAHYGRLDALKYLKSLEIPYEPRKNGTTPLHGAVRKNEIEVVKYLLEKSRMSTPPEDKGARRYSILNDPLIKFNAARTWEEKVLVNYQKEETGLTAAYYAIKNGNIEIARLLHKHGATLNAECTIKPG
jgi:ankyrin repeat protein